MVHVEHFSLYFSSLLFVIRLNLSQSWPYLFGVFYFGKNYYLEVSFALKVILFVAENVLHVIYHVMAFVSNALLGIVDTLSKYLCFF